MNRRTFVKDGALASTALVGTFLGTGRANDGVALKPPDPAVDRASFSSLLSRDVVAGAGHLLRREKPEVVSSAMLKLLKSAR